MFYVLGWELLTIELHYKVTEWQAKFFLDNLTDVKI